MLAARGRGAGWRPRRSPARRWSRARRSACSSCCRRCSRCSRAPRGRWRRRCGSREPRRAGRRILDRRRGRCWRAPSRPRGRTRHGVRAEPDPGLPAAGRARGAGRRRAGAAAADRQPRERPGRAAGRRPTGARSSTPRRAARACWATSRPRSARATPPPSLADAERYREWYGVDGIFLDEVAHDDAQLPYYAALSRALRGDGELVLNPGTVPARGYFELADVVVTYEGPFADYARAARAGARLAARRPADRPPTSSTRPRATQARSLFAATGAPRRAPLRDLRHAARTPGARRRPICARKPNEGARNAHDPSDLIALRGARAARPPPRSAQAPPGPARPAARQRHRPAGAARHRARVRRARHRGGDPRRPGRPRPAQGRRRRAQPRQAHVLACRSRARPTAR